MADNTGAPWLLPYPEDTDLVRDGASDIEALAVAAASGLTAANKGIGTNVVQAVKTDTFSASVDAGSSTVVTGLRVVITPSTATSKILVTANVGGAMDTNFGNIGVILARNTFSIGIGDADSARPRLTNKVVNSANNANDFSTVSLSVLDSPGVTTPVTYDIVIFNIVSATRTVFVNRSSNDPNSAEGARTISTITAIEVAA